MSNPIVSILIPLYNAEQFIEDTIQSVLNQSFRNIELIITDDRSIDASVSKVKQFCDPRIRLIVNEKNLGPEKNWNKALSKAKGKYIKLLCCDDILEKDCLEKQVAVLENPLYASVGLVSCSRYIIDTRNRKIMQRSFEKLHGPYPGRAMIKKIIRCGNNPIGEPAAGLFRVNLLKEIGGYRAIAPYVIDLDFWIRLLMKSDLYVINEPLCSFRVSSQSWSSRLNFRQLIDYWKLIDLTAKEHGSLLSKTDMFFGRIMSVVKTILRMLIFRLYA